MKILSLVLANNEIEIIIAILCFWLTLTAPSTPEQLLLPEAGTALADGLTEFFNFTLTHSQIMPHQTLHGLLISYNPIAVPVEFAP